jgi:hypothetical protein
MVSPAQVLWPALGGRFGAWSYEGLILGDLSVRTYEKLAKTAVKTNPDLAFVGCLADD